MSEEIKYIDIKEFRERGYLQESNRRFFHPLGLALSVEVDDETGEETLGAVWDSREDPEGIVFGGGYGADRDKATAVDMAWRLRAAVRKERFGWVVQPCGAEPPEES
jgi:hypothetical protein